MFMIYGGPISGTLMTFLKSCRCFFSVAAIRCYDCLPGPPGNICTMFANVTDCDEVPGEKYDACGKASYEIALGNNTLTMNALTCAVKVCLSNIWVHPEKVY